MAVGSFVGTFAVNVAAGGDAYLIPSGDEVYLITEVGSSSFAGAAPDGAPEVSVYVTNGASLVTIRNETSGGMWTPLRLMIDKTWYLQIRNDNAAQQNIFACGIVVQE